MAYGQDISVLDQRLDLYKTYLISNAGVSEVYANFSVSDEHYKFLWSLNRRTLIQDVDEEDKIVVQGNSEIITTPFSCFYGSMAKRELINVFGAIFKKLPREFVITDRKKRQRTILSFLMKNHNQSSSQCGMSVLAFKARAEIQKLLEVRIHPIILARRVAVTTYQGLSLSTRYDTSIELNPKGQHAAALKEWRVANAQAIQQINSEELYMDSLIRFGHPDLQKKTNICDM
ncbi:unnamed protein product, partial [Cuscuta europaea]